LFGSSCLAMNRHTHSELVSDNEPNFGADVFEGTLVLKERGSDTGAA
jgi:hypothetical protein